MGEGKSNMASECTIKKKLSIIESVLTELECIAPSRRTAYWQSHMPEITAKDREMFPKEVMELYDQWYAKMSCSILIETVGSLIINIIYLVGFGFLIYILFFII